MSDAIRFDAERNLITVGDRRIVFHCHHYNVVLQRTLDEGLGVRAADIQVRAAMEASRAAITAALPAEVDRDTRVSRAAALFGALGFGRANVSDLDAYGGRVVLETSHYAIGWRAKFGASSRPVCHFATGFWAAAVSVIHAHAPERIVAKETRCGACAEGNCEIEIEVL